MSKTTFSGPVASQNGFVAPTFTSTTLPYFEIGNIVYVENLNTLAFGGVDQWYRQDTGAGLGTGGNVGPGPVGTTYTQGIDYSSSGMVWSSPGNNTGFIRINEFQWNNTKWQDISNKPAGTRFTFEDQQYMQTLSGTLTTGFSGGAGSYDANVLFDTTPFAPMGQPNITYITI
jgi:hypothetical protein